MNLHRPIRPVTLSADAKANVARIEEIWRECRARHSANGPFLFGRFGAADAMYAPVVHRFRTYAIDVAPDTKAYMETMMALPAFQEWTREGLAETLVIAKFEDA
jgi:glutathione S-transferase